MKEIARMDLDLCFAGSSGFMVLREETELKRPVALMPCHVSTQLTNGCVAGVSAFTLNVSDTFFHFQSSLLIVILQHTEHFLPSEGTYLCVK